MGKAKASNHGLKIDSKTRNRAAKSIEAAKQFPLKNKGFIADSSDDWFAEKCKSSNLKSTFG